MSRHVHIHIHTGDAGTKHDPSNGQFTSGGGSSGGKKPAPKLTGKEPVAALKNHLQNTQAEWEKKNKARRDEALAKHERGEELNPSERRIVEEHLASRSPSKDCGCGGHDSEGASIATEAEKKKKKGPALEGGPLATGLHLTKK